MEFDATFFFLTLTLINIQITELIKSCPSSTDWLSTKQKMRSDQASNKKLRNSLNMAEDRGIDDEVIFKIEILILCK